MLLMNLKHRAITPEAFLNWNRRLEREAWECTGSEHTQCSRTLREVGRSGTVMGENVWMSQECFKWNVRTSIPLIMLVWSFFVLLGLQRHSS
jgi:hypothetical protein